MRDHRRFVAQAVRQHKGERPRRRSAPPLREIGFAARLRHSADNRPWRPRSGAIPLSRPAPAATGSGLAAAGDTALSILAAISFCHLLNDMMQSLLPALYPMLKGSYHLSFTQIGLLTFTFQFTASLLQPLVGAFADRSPRPYSLAAGMGFTLVGLILLAYADSYLLLLIAAALIGTGSSVFHPESSRVARMASGGRHGFAQSVFQVGGSLGSAAGPLLAAFIVLPRGQSSVAWFSATALLAMLVLFNVGHWYKTHGLARLERASGARPAGTKRRHVIGALSVLLALVFSKYVYLASIGSYYTFYLIEHFHVSVRSSQLHLFVFLASAAIGGMIGGPLGDRVGSKYIIWVSIVGVLPFTLLLPHANLFWTSVLSVPIGLILASAFPAIVVYAQDLLPGRTGTVAGLFFGLAFGMGSVGAAVLGRLADHLGIDLVYRICAFLPLIGLLAGFLPDVHKARESPAA
ncbi:MAG: MFS transporter [Gammaproteobacteria bacterium]|nr:MFS transporter [Gammaproteobacteria bacterium]